MNAQTSPRTWVVVAGDFAVGGGMDRANLALAEGLADRARPNRLVTHHVQWRRTTDPSPVTRVWRVSRPRGSHLLGSPLLDQAGRWATAAARPHAVVVVNGGNCLVRRPDLNWVHYLHRAWNPEDRDDTFPDHDPNTPPRRLHAAHLAKRRIARWLFLDLERRALAPRRISDGPRLVVVNSQRTRTDLLTHYSLDPDRVRVVYYGIDADRFHPVPAETRVRLRQELAASIGPSAHLDPARPWVLFVGALGDHRKGLDRIFNAFEMLGESWDAQLLIIGRRPPHLPPLSLSTPRLDRSQTVVELGYRADVPDLMAAADLLVSPTRYEAYGLNVHEAICAGLPAIVSRSAGVAERYDELGGEVAEALRPYRLDEPRDPHALASALEHWRANLDQARQGFTPLSEHLRKRSWDDCAADLIALADALE